MMRILPIIAASGLVLTGAPLSAKRNYAEHGQAELAKALEGRVPGKPVQCLDLHSSDSSQIFDATAIVYRDGSKLYVNRPRGGAEMLRDDDVLLTKVYGAGPCRNDSVQLLDRSTRMERGFVILGDFVPYERPDRKR